MKEPIWIEVADALALHDRLLVVHGGAAGIRDASLLASALARPRQMLAYGENTDVVAMAAALTAGILRSHPFVDGNKRTGFVVGVLFLELNGQRFGGSEVAAAQAVTALAAGTLDEAGYDAFLRAHVKRRPLRQ